MKTYTALYSTDKLKNIEYAFTAIDGNDAKRYCQWKFKTTDIIIRNEETGDEFPLIDDWLTPTAYISKCMTSGRYLLYIKYAWHSDVPEFAPVIEVTKDVVPETIINEHDECEARKTTHSLGGWYVGFPKAKYADEGYDFIDCCTKYGELTFNEIKG